MFFWNSLAFSRIQWMLAIWSLVLLPFLNSSCTPWKFSTQVLLKPSLKDFEHNLTSMVSEHNYPVVWAFFKHCLSWELEWQLLFPRLWKIHCWIFQICWHIECSTLMALSFRILNSSAGIPFYFPSVVLLFQIHPSLFLVWGGAWFKRTK